MSSIQKPKTRRYQAATIQSQYNAHRIGARHTNRTTLPRETWNTVVFNPCRYCGKIDIRNGVRGDGLDWGEEEISKYDVAINGVDRLDSTKDYSPENSVPCCAMCNYMKRQYSETDFLNHINKIYRHLNLPNEAVKVV